MRDAAELNPWIRPLPSIVITPSARFSRMPLVRFSDFSSASVRCTTSSSSRLSLAFSRRAMSLNDSVSAPSSSSRLLGRFSTRSPAASARLASAMRRSGAVIADASSAATISDRNSARLNTIAERLFPERTPAR
jgi:hypothetical protein